MSIERQTFLQNIYINFSVELFLVLLILFMYTVDHNDQQYKLFVSNCTKDIIKTDTAFQYQLNYSNSFTPNDFFFKKEKHNAYIH